MLVECESSFGDVVQGRWLMEAHPRFFSKRDARLPSLIINEMGRMAFFTNIEFFESRKLPNITDRFPDLPASLMM